MRLKTYLAASSVVALNAAAFAAAPVIVAGQSNLLPNQANQQVQLFISGTDQLAGIVLYAEMDPLSGAAPAFTNIDLLTGTIFGPNNTDMKGKVVNSGTLSNFVTVGTTTTAGTVGDTGLLVTLTVDTTGINAGGRFHLSLTGTQNGSSLFILANHNTIVPSYASNMFSIDAAPDRQWKLNGNGTWGSDNNWTPFAPYAAGDQANFLGALTAGTGTVTLDGERVTGSITFNNNAAQYVIASGTGGSIHLNGPAPSIADLNGSHIISAPIILSGNTAISIPNATSTLTISGTISGASNLSLTGSGKLLLTGTNSFAGTSIGPGATLIVGNNGTSGTLGTGLIANAGTLAFNRSNVLTVNTGISGAGTIIKQAAGTTTLNGNGYTATGDVTISAGQLGFSPTSNTRNTPGISLSFQHLNMSNGTVLDSTNHDMLIGNTTVATVQDQILAAFGAGNNPNGPQITSSTFGIDDAFMIPLSADVFGGVGNQTIDGVPITQPNSVWTKYTYNGDVTLDGLVDSSDIGQVVSDYILNTTTPGLADITTSWTAGDLDFSGAVDANDIGQVVSSYILHSNSPQLGQLDGLAAPSISGGGSAVPEPATLGLFGLGLLGMVRRKGQRRLR